MCVCVGGWLMALVRKELPETWQDIAWRDQAVFGCATAGTHASRRLVLNRTTLNYQTLLF